MENKLDYTWREPGKRKLRDLNKYSLKHCKEQAKCQNNYVGFGTDWNIFVRKKEDFLIHNRRLTLHFQKPWVISKYE